MFAKVLVESRIIIILLIPHLSHRSSSLLPFPKHPPPDDRNPVTVCELPRRVLALENIGAALSVGETIGFTGQMGHEKNDYCMNCAVSARVCELNAGLAT